MNKLFESLKSLLENFNEIFKHPTSIITLIGVIILVLAVIKIKSVKINSRIMAQIGIVIALSTVLSMIAIVKMPYGGSVTLASMVPIILLSMVHGPEIGLLAGFLYGIVQFILGPYVLHPIQVLFDYPLPFMALGLAGYFKDNKILGTVTAVGSRFLFHYLAGIIFWGSYAAEYNMSPYVYSFLYNGAYLLPELIISAVIIKLVPINNLKKILIGTNNSVA
ncbi:energy-coupled thiamine transporter ThiT [Clostridium thermarum]|uniref:energy-coupled thiamine transporter ThiT n=1 Tax=Clostridium thermarum TaxID=1716543 RepID=UPI0013D3CFED|nr:energy-coupled thiamine transporter ThiT [Clostridium thermarum]